MQTPRHHAGRYAALAAAALAALGTAPARAQVLTHDTHARILALGDSLTRGGAYNLGNYRRPLQDLLALDGYDETFVGQSTEQSYAYTPGPAGPDRLQTFNPYQPDHDAYGGFLISDLASQTPVKDDGGVTYPGLNATLTADAPDVILLMIGSNDVSRGTDPGGPGFVGGSGFGADAAQRLDTLVGEIYTARPGVTLVLASVTPSGNHAARAQAFNAYVPQIVSQERALGRRAVFADLYAALAPDTARFITRDGEHPTTAGYDQMARGWYGALTAAPEPSALACLGLGGLALAGLGLTSAVKARRRVAA